MNYEIKSLPALTLRGWMVKFDGVKLATWETIDEIRRRKSEQLIKLSQTEHFSQKIAESRDKFGYAIGENRTDGFYYFIGVNSDISAPDHFELPTQDYIIMTAKGAASRTLFDQLNAELFANILPEVSEEYVYEDSYVIEVVTGGTPNDAQVELRFPVKKNN